jgi:hypothetical protein
MDPTWVSVLYALAPCAPNLLLELHALIDFAPVPASNTITAELGAAMQAS